MMAFAVIFDMDGVIVDNFAYHEKAWQQFCTIHQLDFGEAFRSGIFGGTNRDHLQTFFQKELSDNEIKKFESEKEAIYRELYQPFIEPVNGLVEFLLELRNANIKIALATSSPPINVEFVLRNTGTAEFFTTILDASDIAIGKPNPEIFLKSADALQTASQNCIVFEDSINGINAAKNAGMKVVALKTTHSAKALPPVDLIIPDFSSIGLKQLEKLI
ncbi:MAG TPA: HAD family phosphatase [Bacteroidales bacterium]|nr:HAD family phosphatase [Bacteroidales bacterium]